MSCAHESLRFRGCVDEGILKRFSFQASYHHLYARSAPISWYHVWFLLHRSPTCSASSSRVDMSPFILVNVIPVRSPGSLILPACSTLAIPIMDTSRGLRRAVSSLTANTDSTNELMVCSTEARKPCPIHSCSGIWRVAACPNEEWPVPRLELVA